MCVAVLALVVALAAAQQSFNINTVDVVFTTSENYLSMGLNSVRFLGDRGGSSIQKCILFGLMADIYIYIYIYIYMYIYIYIHIYIYIYIAPCILLKYLCKILCGCIISFLLPFIFLIPVFIHLNTPIPVYL